MWRNPPKTTSLRSQHLPEKPFGAPVPGSDGTALIWLLLPRNEGGRGREPARGSLPPWWKHLAWCPSAPPQGFCPVRKCLLPAQLGPGDQPGSLRASVGRPDTETWRRCTRALFMGMRLTFLFHFLSSFVGYFEPKGCWLCLSTVQKGLWL